MATTKATTRAGAVYEQLRHEIFDGDFHPGQRLRFVELADRFSVSQSVIREALTRLAGEGLAVALPQQGFRVVTLSLEDLDQLTEARCEIESLTFRLSVERGDVHWESSLVAAHHLLSAVETERGILPTDDWFTAHEAFHRALLEGCGNERLLGVALSLRDSAALYRHWAVPIGHDYGRDVVAEHRRLLEAALAREPIHASGLLCEHIERTTAALRPLAEAQHNSDDTVLPSSARHVEKGVERA